VLGLARRASLLEESGRQARREAAKAARDAENGVESSSLLLARVGRNRIAIPLSCIARLEEIPASRIECAGKADVIQYRGRIMSIVRLRTLLGIESEIAHRDALSNEEQMLPLVVCALETDNVGVVVDAIEDIVEERIQIETRQGQRGILGSAIVQQKVTDLLDVRELAGAQARSVVRD